ncbi:MAG: hypothetical protein P8J50_13025 [Acidimicrobiales bacterium]|nr:hypothetical protein [Acidimicrobiales bacterium]
MAIACHARIDSGSVQVEVVEEQRVARLEDGSDEHALGLLLCSLRAGRPRCKGAGAGLDDVVEPLSDDVDARRGVTAVRERDLQIQ